MPDLLDHLAVPLAALDGSVFLTQPDGRIAWVNTSFIRSTGYSAEEARGRLRTDLITGRFTRTPEFARLAADLAAAVGADAEFATRTRAGRPYWVDLQVRPIVENGVVVAQVGLERDVTSRRQAEERARRALVRAESLAVALRREKRFLTGVLSTIPHVVWWKNAELRYVGCNPAYLDFRGLSSLADVVGRLEGQLETLDELGPQLSLMERSVIDTHKPLVETTLVMRNPDGRPRTLLVSVLPQEGDTGVIGVGTDVTRLTDLERQLAQASRLESIGQLAAGIAHEINTPVQYVSDNTRFLADSFSSVMDGMARLVELAHVRQADDPGGRAVRAEVGEILERLDLEFVADEVPSALVQSLEGLERVAQIVRAMKDFSHPGSGRVETDLNRIVESTVQVSRNEWKYVATLDLNLDPTVGLVPCYEGELKQVVLNIVVNAAQAIQERRRGEGTTPRQGLITVSTRRDEDEVRIVVSDDGVGMTDDVRRRIFDPFFTTKEVGKGTGQGLSLAHNTVVAKHGGRIDVTSQPGQGATFTIALPVEASTHAPSGSAGRQ